MNLGEYVTKFFYQLDRIAQSSVSYVGLFERIANDLRRYVDHEINSETERNQLHKDTNRLQKEYLNILYGKFGKKDEKPTESKDEL